MIRSSPLYIGSPGFDVVPEIGSPAERLRKFLRQMQTCYFK
jgi:hypothetical protein